MEKIVISKSASTVFALYRAKMRIAREMGYVYGNWKQDKICKSSKLERTLSLKKVINNSSRGELVGNNIRYHYKKGIYECDLYDAHNMVNDGFYWLRKLNVVYSKYQNTPYSKNYVRRHINSFNIHQ